MPHIKSFRIVDGQSHKDSTLDFYPGFNLIIGSTNSGKSTIIRLLRLNYIGDWSKSWVRWGAKNVETYIQYEDGTIVHRTKGVVNQFSVTDPNGNTEDFSGFGDKTPELVAKALGTRAFRLDRDKEVHANISRQHDSLFLLNESGSYCAKVFGRLSGLHLVDVALRTLNVDISNSVRESTEEARRIEEMKERLKAYDALEAKKTRLVELKNRVEEQRKIREESKKLSTIATDVRSFNNELVAFKHRVGYLNQLKSQDLKGEFTKKLLDMGMCPSCGSEMTEEKAKIMLETGNA